MISLQPLEYNSDYDGIILEETKTEFPTKITARSNTQATIDGGAFGEINAVTEAGKDFEYEFRGLARAQEIVIMDLMENSIHLKKHSTESRYASTGYITEYTGGAGTVKIKFAVDEVIS